MSTPTTGDRPAQRLEGAAAWGGDLDARLRRGVVLGDGGYLLELEHRGYVQAGPFTPEVVVEHPDAVRQLHTEFLRAGADVLQALTFYADEGKLGSRWGPAFLEEVNRAAVGLAREVACRHDVLVAGVITQTTTFEPADRASLRRAEASFSQQIELQQSAGVDFFFAETFRYVSEACIALRTLRTAGASAVVTLNIGPGGSADGVTVEECARCLAGGGARVVGVNCSYGPDTSLAVAERMRAVVGSDVDVACQPVGYATPDAAVPFTAVAEFPLALEHLQLSRAALAGFARRADAAGIRYIGGCCGVGAHHVRAMAEALGRRPPATEKSPALDEHVLAGVRQRSDARYWEEIG
jgi:methionine synthase I (cobalamin-dependent)